MAKMNATEIRNFILNAGLSVITFPEDTIQYHNAKYAIPVEIEGETRYLKVECTVGNNKDTKTTKAFDPVELREEWLEEKEYKEQEKARQAERKSKSKSKSKSKTENE